MVEALEHVHAMGVIHCDVKSMNFLLHSEGNGEDDDDHDDVPDDDADLCDVKLCDFGMSARDAERVIVSGSPVYMSPEHLTAWSRIALWARLAGNGHQRVHANVSNMIFLHYAFTELSIHIHIIMFILLRSPNAVRGREWLPSSRRCERCAISRRGTGY